MYTVLSILGIWHRRAPGHVLPTDGAACDVIIMERAVGKLMMSRVECVCVCVYGR